MNSIRDWYKKLTPETRAFIRAAGFEAYVTHLLENTTSKILVQAFAKRWWDTTHTILIIGREMSLTPYNFHRLTSLRNGSFY